MLVLSRKRQESIRIGVYTVRVSDIDKDIALLSIYSPFRPRFVRPATEAEWILVADDIRVMVTSFEGSRVKIGIDAPRSVEITRIN